MQRRYLKVSAILTGLALVAGACAGGTAPSGGGGGGGSAAKTVKIYSSLPLTGPSRAQTLTVVNGIKMAMDENGGKDGTNAKVGSITVEYESLDDATAAKQSWDAAQEAENARKAAEDSKTVGYIGTFNSGAARISIPILNKAGIVMISPANTATDLTMDRTKDSTYYASGTKNYFRVIPNDSIQGLVGANWMASLNAKKVFVVDDTDLYGKGLADVFVANAPKAGLTIVGREGAPKADNFNALATKIKSSGAEGVYYGGIVDNNPAVLVKNLKAAGFTGPIMGADGIQCDEMIKQMGSAGEGVYATFGGVSVDKYTGKQAEWLAKYKTKYGSDPQPYAIYGYEAANVLLKAVSDSSGDRTKMVASVRKIGTNYEGVLGKWSFDQFGDTSNTAHTGVVVQGGK
ncbi:MAG TPA: branched-chain amino acid ABC transporter substrate-binding protein, partial [Solirubrobacteraceae bacterium]|nr:branched-chain amino acid ABC transporter substrate-binding protein [Solirubrobacteraceae bacterium]